MLEPEALAESLRSELEDYLSALREEDELKKWLGDEHFKTMFAGHEANVRRTLDEFIGHYIKQVPEDGMYRAAALAHADAALRVCLESCKQILRTTADAMVGAFTEFSPASK